MNLPTAEQLYDAQITFQNAVAIGYEIDPEEIEVYCHIMPLAGEAAFELVMKAEAEAVGAVIAGRGETFEEAVAELHENAQKALTESRLIVRPVRPEQTPARARGHLRLVHSA